MKKQTGTVSWFNDGKGYGEIVSEGRRQFFFTYKELAKKGRHKSIEKGAKITFSPGSRIVFGLCIAEDVKELA